MSGTSRQRQHIASWIYWPILPRSLLQGYDIFEVISRTDISHWEVNLVRYLEIAMVTKGAELFEMIPRANARPKEIRSDTTWKIAHFGPNLARREGTRALYLCFKFCFSYFVPVTQRKGDDYQELLTEMMIFPLVRPARSFSNALTVSSKGNSSSIVRRILPSATQSPSEVRIGKSGKPLTNTCWRFIPPRNSGRNFLTTSPRMLLIVAED